MAKIALDTVNAPASVLVDCSHANSGKDPSRQPKVLDSVMEQVKRGADCIHGVMVESHLHPGTQAFPRPVEQLKYGVSITDGCIGWEDTEACLRKAAEIIDEVRFS
jgi:3-deoxy-7-phosphoheptulonate synthase